MNDYPRRKLRELVGQQGASLCEDAQRCEGALRDACPGERREVNVLVTALKARVAEDPVPRSIKVVRFAVWAPSMIVLFLSPIAIALGAAPVPEEALYFTLVALALFWSAMSLLMLVFAGRRRATA